MLSVYNTVVLASVQEIKFMHGLHGYLNTASILLLSFVVAVVFMLYVLFNFFRESRKTKRH